MSSNLDVIVLERSPFQLSDQKRAELRAAFDVFDTTKRDLIPFAYFKLLVEGLGFPVTVNEIFEIEGSNVGLISFNAFMEYCKKCEYLLVF
jgi:Ca2+-binding EF-hand superfamily protein